MYEIADPKPGPLEALPPLLLGADAEELGWAGPGIEAGFGWEGCAATFPPGSACFAGACAGVDADEVAGGGADDGAGGEDGERGRAGAEGVGGATVEDTKFL